MPKNSSKMKNSKNKNKSSLVKREILYPDDTQEYAKIIKLLGDRRIMVILDVQTEVLAIIPGKFRKRCWMKIGDIIIVSKREFQESKYDVCYKYNEDEVRILAKNNQIPEFFLDNTTNTKNDNNILEFQESDENNSEDEDENNSEDDFDFENI
jgi:translation initiation factor 1A